MKMKDAVMLAAVLLGLDDTAAKLEQDELDTDGALLLRCANLVVNEICVDYFPLKTTSKLTSDGNGEIRYSDFPLPVSEVFKAVNSYGESVPFREFYDRLLLDKNTEYEVTYSYILPEADINGEVSFPERITARAVAYGIAAEYSVISQATDEALTWDRRYKDALARALRVAKEVRVRRRKWL